MVTQYDTNILGPKHKNHWNILYSSWKSSYFSNFLRPFHQIQSPRTTFRGKGKMLYLFPNFHKSWKMMRLSIITPIDHQRKGTNLHKILVLYHLQLRRAIRPRCRTNILMRGNHRTAHHTSVTLSTNILIFQCHHHSFSPSHPPEI